MIKDKKKVIKERLSGQYKQSLVKEVMVYFKANYPELNRTQVRRVLSHAYQSLRKEKQNGHAGKKY